MMALLCCPPLAAIAMKPSGFELGIGKAEHFADLNPCAFIINQMNRCDGFENAIGVRQRSHHRHLNVVIVYSINPANIINEYDWRLRCVFVTIERNHGDLAPGPSGHIPDRRVSSPHYCTSFGLNCHSPVTPLQLSRLFFLTSQPATTTDNPPFWFHSADRTSAGRRRQPKAAKVEGSAAAVTHLPLPGGEPPLRRETAGGRRSVSPVYPAVLCLPPAFSSSRQDRSHRPTAAPPAHRANQGDAATRSLETRFRRRSP